MQESGPLAAARIAHDKGHMSRWSAVLARGTGAILLILWMKYACRI